MGKYLTPALDKGLDILEYLSSTNIPQSQMEIAQGLNKSPNELYRMLVCLNERGYLLKSSAGKYSLSLKLYHLSHRHSPIDGLKKLARPYMEELANITRQSCHLSILYYGQLMVVSQVRSPGPVSLSIEEGSLFPLCRTTSGRTLLAFLEEEQQQKELLNNQEYASFSKTKRAAFDKRLVNIQKNGYELAQSEITIGVTDIAVPIGSSSSGIYGALAISSLRSISKENNSGEFLIEKMLEVADKINRSFSIETPV